MADGSAQTIDTIQVGDEVLATNPHTGDTGPATVEATIQSHGPKELVEVTIDGETVTATDGHPFWVDDHGHWIPASELHPGQQLTTRTGATATIGTVTRRTTLTRVHNLTIQGVHTHHITTPAGDHLTQLHRPATTTRRPEKPTTPPSWGTQGGHYAETADLNPAAAARRILDEQYRPGGRSGRGPGSELSPLQKWLSRYFQ